jgi:porin
MDKQGIAIAARYGHADGEVNKIEDFWAVGTQCTGLIPGRDKDQLGIGVGQGILADEYARVHPGADRETVYEIYYAITVAPWLIISPDLQYITNVGGDSDDGDAFVAGLRIKMSL